MARARDPNRDRAFEIWKQHNGEIDLVQISKQLDVSSGTLRGWKSKDKWEDQLNGTLQSKRNAPKNKERSRQPREPTKSQQVAEIDNDDLTDKQRLFVLEYMRDFNITRAAIAAGYSKRSAHVLGWETLRNPKVQAEIQRLKEMLTTELGIDIQRVISEYMKIAFADITDYAEFGQQDMPLVTKKGPVIDPKTGEVMTVKESFVAFRDHSEVDGAVISEVKQGRDGISVKLHDKMKALDKLEKYVGFMSEEQKLRIKKMQLELAEMSGEKDGDPHKQGHSYEEALNAQAADVFADEVDSDEEA